MRSLRKKAESLLQAGRFADAEEAFSACLDGDPRDSSALIGLGYCALVRNDLNEAERRLDAALRLKPRSKAARGLLGELHYRRDDFDRAAPHFASSGRAAKARQLASFAGHRPNEIEGDAYTRIPFLETDPLPVLDLHVNGNGPARFLLDTGGGELILDPEFAGRVGAVGFGAERGIFGGGRKARVEHGRVDSVRLGGFVLRNVPVAVLDLGAVAPTVGEARLDGILGTVPLSRFTSTIDYPGGALLLERASEAPSPRGFSVPFWLAGDHFVVAWGAVNGGPETLFFVDTGLAGNGFTCPSSTLREARIEVKQELAEEARALGSSAYRVVPFVVDDLRLGDFRRQHVDGVAGAFPPQLERGLGFRVGGLISHQFFRSCALTFDFAAMRLRLQPV